MNKKLVLTTLGIAIIASPFAFGLTSNIQAQEPTNTGQTQVREERRKNFLSRVANILGISQTSLESAMTQAKTEEVDQAVADGKLDADKAAKMKERIKSGKPPFGDSNGRRGNHGSRHNGAMVEAMGEFFGMTTDELKTARKDGLTIKDFFEKQGKNKEDFRSFMDENYPDVRPKQNRGSRDSQNNRDSRGSRNGDSRGSMM